MMRLSILDLRESNELEKGMLVLEGVRSKAVLASHMAKNFELCGYARREAPQNGSTEPMTCWKQTGKNHPFGKWSFQ